MIFIFLIVSLIFMLQIQSDKYNFLLVLKAGMNLVLTALVYESIKQGVASWESLALIGFVVMFLISFVLGIRHIQREKNTSATS